MRRLVGAFLLVGAVAFTVAVPQALASIKCWKCAAGGGVCLIFNQDGDVTGIVRWGGC